MIGTIRSRLALLESASVEATSDGSATQAFTRWCLQSSGFDPDSLQPQTEAEKTLSNQVMDVLKAL